MMTFRTRRGDLKFSTAVIAVVIIIFFILYGSRRKHLDFRTQAMSKLQLASISKSSNCRAEDVSSWYSKSVSVVVSTQAKEEAVITQTINSILAHTDPSILEEIIISTDRHITENKKQLLIQEFSSYEPLIHILSGEAEQRIKNKLVAGHVAKGDVVVYVDDTVVVTSNYLSPLLEALHDHPERIAVPSFDYLTDLTASAEKTWTQMKWTFGWQLDIEAYELTFQEMASKPENEDSPTMVFDSSAFALYKTYLEKLGGLKNKMDYSSSIDLSFATWLCGDGAYVVPCSRVAKIRPNLTIRPGDEKTKHMIANRYLTEKYLNIFIRVNRKAVEFNDEDKAHMKVEASFQRKCPHDFDWYMANVVKNELFVPSTQAVAYGYLNSNSGTICFRQTPAMIFLGYIGCSMHSRGTMVEYLKTGQLRMGSECMIGSDKGYMVTDPCDYEKESFKWTTTKYRQLKNSANRCISHSTDPYPEENQRQVLMFTDCADESNPDSLRWQKWYSLIWLD